MVKAQLGYYCYSSFLHKTSVSTEPSKMLCKDLSKVGNQKGKAMDRKDLASKLTNLNRPISVHYVNWHALFLFEIGLFEELATASKIWLVSLTLSPIDFKTNQIIEAVASSRRQTKPTHSFKISSLTGSSSKGFNISEASRFKTVKSHLPEIHIKPVPRNVKHFLLENNHPLSPNVLNAFPAVANDHTTHESNDIACNQITG